MLWVPQKGRLLVEHNTGSVGGTFIGTGLTTGASSSTKGTAVELIASTAFDAYLITIIASHYGSSALLSKGCLDILIGNATEEVLIPNLLMGNCGWGSASANKGPKVWTFPLYIPAGSRIAAQAAGDRLSTNMFVAIYLYGGYGHPPFRVGSKVMTYGIGTVPNGTSITPGASTAEGSWTEITASTAEAHFALSPSLQVDDATMSLSNLTVDLGVGSATEEEVGSGYWFATDTNERTMGPEPYFPCIVDIPSGTRVVMRASNSVANDAAYQVAIHAVS